MIQNSSFNTRLAPILSQDGPKLFAWRNDRRINKWCRQHDLLNELDHESWMTAHQKDKSIKMYSIRNQVDELIGVCGLTSIDLINRRAEFSLYIGPEFHGQGYGEDSLRLLLWHSFRHLPLNIIYGESFCGNPALKMFRRIGFKKEGTRRDFYFRDGSFIDAEIFSIKRNELKWKKK